MSQKTKDEGQRTKDDCASSFDLCPLSFVLRGARVLITGGLGFLGSNLALRLVALGARVTLVDAMIPEYGGNLFNIEPIRDQVALNFGDIRDRHAMDWL